jgi:predicted HTH transcriptional regulator
MTERQSVPSALLSDININLVREHIDTAIKRRGYDSPTEPEEYLIEHGYLLHTDERLLPTLAGILALGREPHRHASVCGIDITHFKGCTL